ncbi:MAG: type IV pili methyl-accepting chemotaxis transducer N-terminal domain-containing protein [Pseudomonadota bacterium]
MPFSSSLTPSRFVTSFAVAMMIAVPANAAQDFEFDGSKVRVNLSNKLTMLGQKVAAAGCSIESGINVENAREELISAKRDFNTIVTGLWNGDPALGIPSHEENSVVLRSLKQVERAWEPIESAADAMLSGDDIAAASEVIASGDAALAEATGILASDILNIYSNPHEMTQSDALALNFSGRQRMLTYQISKSICGIASGNPAYGTQDTLQEHTNMYGLTLSALQAGMAEVGINPPPNELIEKELAAVAEDWAKITPALSSAIETGSADANDVGAFGSVADDIVLDMDNVVTLYMLAAPDSEDVYLVALEDYAREELGKWLEQPALIEAVLAQNVAHETLTQADIDALDQTWRAEAKAGGGDLIDRLLAGDASEFLRVSQDATAGFVTEVFAMDNKGLNVAQSVETSDYWQGDEAKWKQTFGDGSGATHISEVEFDDSTGAYQTQVSLPLKHPETGELIGAITFGINVQSLL